LILVDDGSGDADLAFIIARLAASEPRIRALAVARNGGISAASNFALGQARGEVWCFSIMTMCSIRTRWR
jgi:succinoglycan biosynthesis protein ExoO